MKGDECLDGLDVKNGLVHVAEQGLVANILNPTPPFLQVVPEMMEEKVILKVIYLIISAAAVERDYF